MSILKHDIKNVLLVHFPEEILDNLLNEYQHIKEQFFLNHFQPSELNGARFGECVLRLVEYVDTGIYTIFGKSIDSERIINHAVNNVNLVESMRFFIPRLTRVVLDIRNKRDIAHVGGEVNPNYSDSLLIVHCIDWILVELVRYSGKNDINQAQKIVESINEIKIPIITEVEGFVRVQNVNLNLADKALVILYHKQPIKVSDRDIYKWIKYSNFSYFKTKILQKLDSEALIHYDNNFCSLLPKGIMYVEKKIDFSLLV